MTSDRPPDDRPPDEVGDGQPDIFELIPGYSDMFEQLVDYISDCPLCPYCGYPMGDGGIRDHGIGARSRMWFCNPCGYDEFE